MSFCTAEVNAVLPLLVVRVTLALQSHTKNSKHGQPDAQHIMSMLTLTILTKLTPSSAQQTIFRQITALMGTLA